MLLFSNRIMKLPNRVSSSSSPSRNCSRSYSRGSTTRDKTPSLFPAKHPYPRFCRCFVGEKDLYRLSFFVDPGVAISSAFRPIDSAPGVCCCCLNKAVCFTLCGKLMSPFPKGYSIALRCSRSPCTRTIGLSNCLGRNNYCRCNYLAVRPLPGDE